MYKLNCLWNKTKTKTKQHRKHKPNKKNPVTELKMTVKLHQVIPQNLANSITASSYSWPWQFPIQCVVLGQGGRATDLSAPGPPAHSPLLPCCSLFHYNGVIWSSGWSSAKNKIRGFNIWQPFLGRTSGAWEFLLFMYFVHEGLLRIPWNAYLLLHHQNPF